MTKKQNLIFPKWKYIFVLLSDFVTVPAGVLSGFRGIELRSPGLGSAPC